MYIVGILLFIAALILLIVAVRKKQKKFWITALCLEAVTIATNVLSTWYYDNLPAPDVGIFPGFTYLGEVLVGFAFSLLGGILFIITITWFTIWIRKQKK